MGGLILIKLTVMRKLSILLICHFSFIVFLYAQQESPVVIQGKMLNKKPRLTTEEGGFVPRVIQR